MTKKKDPLDAIVVRFVGFRCELVWHQYQDKPGRVGLVLWEKNNHDEGPVCTATVNVPRAKLAPGEGLIKDYSENEGILAALVAAGVCEDTGRDVSTGFASVDVVRWLIGPGAVKR